MASGDELSLAVSVVALSVALCMYALSVKLADVCSAAQDSVLEAVLEGEASEVQAEDSAAAVSLAA